MKQFDAIRRQLVQKKLLHWTRITAFAGIVGVGAALWQLYDQPTIHDASIEQSSVEDEKVSPGLDVVGIFLSNTSLSIPASLEIELRNSSNTQTVQGALVDIDLGRNRVEACDWSARLRGELEETGSKSRVRIRLVTLEPLETFSLRCLISDAGFEKILLGGGNVRNRIEIQSSAIRTTLGGRLLSRLEPVLGVVSWILGIGISLGILVGIWRIGDNLIDRYFHR